jgi:GGDEF domain-containing protein
MSLQGPIVVVGDRPDAALKAALAAAGATQIETCAWANAAPIIAKTWPAAVIVNEIPAIEHAGHIAAIKGALDTMREPYLPVLTRVAPDCALPFEGALPLPEKANGPRVAALTGSALRVRTLQATIFRRLAALKAEGNAMPDPIGEPEDPLADGVVLVAGRGRSYPELCTAVGERVAMIGSLSVESAARYLNTRNLDGIFIGEGFGPPTVDAFLTALGEDYRFRDLPVAQIGGANPNVDVTPLPNYERFDAPPAEVLEWMLPLIRLHAREARLQRQLAAIEANGLIDPHTGLHSAAAFSGELAQSAEAARRERAGLSLASFAFPAHADRATLLDAARQMSRLVRSVDYAAWVNDHTILVALPGTALREAHLIARRLAASLSATMLTSDRKEGRIDPSVSLVTLKPNDTVESLIARVTEQSHGAPQVAAE